MRDQAGFNEKLNQLQGALDYDALFAKSLQQRPVVLGYYFTSDRDGRSSGFLPAAVKLTLFRAAQTGEKLRRENVRAFRDCSSEREFALTSCIFEPTHVGCYKV